MFVQSSYFTTNNTNKQQPHLTDILYDCVVVEMVTAYGDNLRIGSAIFLPPFFCSDCKNSSDQNSIRVEVNRLHITVLLKDNIHVKSLMGSIHLHGPNELYFVPARAP